MRGHGGTKVADDPAEDSSSYNSPLNTDTCDNFPRELQISPLFPTPTTPRCNLGFYTAVMSFPLLNQINILLCKIQYIRKYCQCCQNSNT